MELSFSQWDILGMSLFGLLVGFITGWYSKRKYMTTVNKYI